MFSGLVAAIPADESPHRLEYVHYASSVFLHRDCAA